MGGKRGRFIFRRKDGVGFTEREVGGDAARK